MSKGVGLGSRSCGGDRKWKRVRERGRDGQAQRGGGGRKNRREKKAKERQSRREGRERRKRRGRE